MQMDAVWCCVRKQFCKAACWAAVQDAIQVQLQERDCEFWDL
jgi:hypothetical protein